MKRWSSVPSSSSTSALGTVLAACGRQPTAQTTCPSPPRLPLIRTGYPERKNAAQELANRFRSKPIGRFESLRLGGSRRRRPDRQVEASFSDIERPHDSG